MKIGVIGAGTVGRATARCWMEHAEEVLAHDRIKARETHDLISTLEADYVFLCLPERELGEFFQHNVPSRFLDAPFILKSTVPIGTTRLLKETFSLKRIVHNPEFLTARCSIWDAANPPCQLIGTPDGWVVGKGRSLADDLYDLYEERFPGVPVTVLQPEETELIKLAVNAFAALKVTFFNDVHEACKRLGLSFDDVRAGMMSDGRIGNAWTKVPGPDGRQGFGGTCLPKDLDHWIETVGEFSKLPEMVKALNEWHRQGRRPAGSLAATEIKPCAV